MWIARNKDNLLMSFKRRPLRDKTLGIFKEAETGDFISLLPNTSFLDVTWENSPRKVKNKLI